MGGTKGPGIDLENSDVFETSEQTEADQVRGLEFSLIYWLSLLTR